MSLRGSAGGAPLRGVEHRVTPDGPIPYPALAALGLLLGGLRLAAADGAPDRVHPLDPAELKLAELGRALRAGGGWEEVARQVAGLQNLHHGGFLWVSLLVAALGLLLPDELLALRAAAALTGALAWALWAAAGFALLGPRWGALAAGVLALPPPWALQWSLTPWGSHPEAAAFPALWLLLLRGPPRPLALGAAAGSGVGFSALLGPTAALALLLGAGPWRARLLGLGLGLLPFGLPWALERPWARGLTEDAASTPLGLLRGAVDLPLAAASVAELLPPPLVASGVAGRVAPWLSAVAFGAALIGARAAHRGATPALRLLAWGPLLHLAALALLSPHRPALQHRYLLPWLPALLLLPLVGAAGGGRARGLGLVPVLVSLLGLPPALQLLQGRDPVARAAYDPWSLQALGLEQLPLRQAPAVAVFLADRRAGAGAGGPGVEGFAEAFARRKGYPVWGEPRALPGPAPDLRRRLDALAAAGPASRALIGRNAGWGLLIAHDLDLRAAQLGAQRLGPWAEPVAAGVAEAAAALGVPGPAAPPRD